MQTEHQIPDLNSLASMTAKDFRAMSLDALVALAHAVGKNFNGLSLKNLNPAYAEVIAEVEKTQKDSLEKAAFGKGKEIYDIIKASALGSFYVGFRMEVVEGENGPAARISYLTKERGKRDTVKSQPAASKVLQV